jgi:hypothetical protein
MCYANSYNNNINNNNIIFYNMYTIVNSNKKNVTTVN